jgi:hypothetical protein
MGKVETRREGEFFSNVDLAESNNVIQECYRAMISEAYKTVIDVGIGIDYNEEQSNIVICTKDLDSERICKKGETAKNIS